jgi:hypothetical protein
MALSSVLKQFPASLLPTNFFSSLARLFSPWSFLCPISLYNCPITDSTSLESFFVYLASLTTSDDLECQSILKGLGLLGWFEDVKPILQTFIMPESYHILRLGYGWLGFCPPVKFVGYIKQVASCMTIRFLTSLSLNYLLLNRAVFPSRRRRHYMVLSFIIACVECTAILSHSGA